MPARLLSSAQKAALIKCATRSTRTLKVHKATGKALAQYGYGTYTERKGLFYINKYGLRYAQTGELREPLNEA